MRVARAVQIFYYDIEQSTAITATYFDSFFLRLMDYYIVASCLYSLFNQKQKTYKVQNIFVKKILTHRFCS